MVNWYKNLYVGDTAKKKQKKWMRRIENKKAVPGVWLLTLPSNQQNNLDVIPADLLLQPAVRRNCPMIVGLAVSREEAFELVEAIALETYRETGEVKIREWLLNRIEGCESKVNHTSTNTCIHTILPLCCQKLFRTRMGEIDIHRKFFFLIIFISRNRKLLLRAFRQQFLRQFLRHIRELPGKHLESMTFSKRYNFV